ncbi:MAG: SRPBCC family protein [Acidimicrobiales bacterium]
MTEIAATVDVPAAPDVVWSVLAGFGEIATWADTVDHSCLLTAASEGVGASRRVQVGSTVLVEQIIVWEPPRVLAYRIEGLPPVVRAVRNEWRVEPGGAGSLVTLTASVVAGPRPPMRIAARLVAKRLATANESMLAGLRAEATDRATRETSAS